MTLWHRLRRSPYLQSIALLGSGTILGQVVVIAASPVLTRLYTPSDFGLLALFLGMVGCVMPAVCGKFEVAMVVAKTTRESEQLLGISILVAFMVSLLTFFGVWVYRDWLVQIIDAGGLGQWVLLAPLALFLGGVLRSFNYYSNCLGEYQTLSRSKILAAFISVALSIALGWFGLHYGLLLSSIATTALVNLWLLYNYRQRLNIKLLCWNWRKKILVRRFRDFPLYNASTGLLDGLTLALPVFFLSRYFPDSVVGYYALMIRVTMAPLGFLSTAVSQVNLKKVADMVQKHQPVRPYLLKATLMLLIAVLPPMLFLLLSAPPLFELLFGDEWRIAGTYLKILIPGLALKFVASTLSSTFGATGHNRLGALWKVTAFVVTLVAFLVFAPRVGVMEMFVVMLVIDLVLYSFYYLLAWRAAGHPLAYK